MWCSPLTVTSPCPGPGTRQTLRLWDLSSQYVETIIAKCIDSYTARRAEEGVTDWLEDIVNKMFDR